MPQPQFTSRVSSPFGSFPPAVKWLLISNTAIFIITGLLPREFAPHVRLLALTPVAVVDHFAIWQLVTYLFLHGGISPALTDPWHLVFNMLALWMFGSPLEETWGTRRFLKYYFVCGIGAGVCDVIANALVGSWGTSTIGASGAIFGLLIAFGMLFPESTVLMGFLFPIKAKYMVAIYAAVELYMLRGVNTGVSNFAHLGGMLVGYIYLKSKLPAVHVRMPDMAGAYRQWKMQRAKRKFQVYMRKHGGPRSGPWVN